MKNKFLTINKCLIFSGVAIAVIGAIVIGSMSQTPFMAFRGVGNPCTVCRGNHYSANYSVGGYGKSRVKEYWVCCECHSHYLDTNSIPGYQASNFVDAGVGSPDQISAPDDRLFFGGTENTYNINKLTTGTITVDGVRDEGYDVATKYNFSTVLDGDSKMTATLEAVWKDSLIYLFIDVKDEVLQFRPSGSSERWIEWDDSIQLKVDTLHSEELASTEWDGKTGGNYRNDKACEGFYKSCANISNINPGTKCDASKGVFMDNWSYLSALQISDSYTFIASLVNQNADGYSYEICLNTEFVPAIVNNVIGINILLFDYQNSAYKGMVPFEATNCFHEYLRSYSNFLLVGRGE